MLKDADMKGNQPLNNNGVGGFETDGLYLSIDNSHEVHELNVSHHPTFHPYDLRYTPISPRSILFVP